MKLAGMLHIVACLALTSLGCGCLSTQSTAGAVAPLPAELRRTHVAVSSIYGDATGPSDKHNQLLAFEEESLETVISTSTQELDVPISWHPSVDRQQLLSMTLSEKTLKLKLDRICAEAGISWHMGRDTLFIDSLDGRSLDSPVKYTYVISGSRTFSYEPSLRCNLTRDSIVARLASLCAPRSMSHLKVVSTENGFIIEAYAGEHAILIDWFGAFGHGVLQVRR